MKLLASLKLFFARDRTEILNIHGLALLIMKYCHDCLTPINRNSKEEYCDFCKRDRALKSSTEA
jgi:hypothetical protein